MTTDGEVEQMPVFEKYKPAKEGPDVPAKLKSKVQEGKWFHFEFKHGQVQFYGLQKGQTQEDILGKAIGKREAAYRLEWWRLERKGSGSQSDLKCSTQLSIRRHRCP